MIRLWCVIGGWGALGVLLRFFIVQCCGQVTSLFPWATLASNCLGAGLLGILLPLFVKLDLPPWMVQGITIGFLGGLTTFSSFIGDLYHLWEAGQHGVLALYAFAMLVGGGAIFLLSFVLTKRYFL